MVVPGTGEVRALAQSRPMGREARSRARPSSTTSSRRSTATANGFQAGSTFKVFVLAAAIKQGIPLSTQINAPQHVDLPDSTFKVLRRPYASTEAWHGQQLHRARARSTSTPAPSSR